MFALSRASIARHKWEEEQGVRRAGREAEHRRAAAQGRLARTWRGGRGPACRPWGSHSRVSARYRIRLCRLPALRRWPSRRRDRGRRRRAPRSPAWRSSPAAMRKVCLPRCLHGSDRCRFSTSRPASRRTSPMRSTPNRAPAMSSLFTSPPHWQAGYKMRRPARQVTRSTARRFSTRPTRRTRRHYVARRFSNACGTCHRSPTSCGRQSPLQSQTSRSRCARTAHARWSRWPPDQARRSSPSSSRTA